MHMKTLSDNLMAADVMADPHSYYRELREGGSRALERALGRMDSHPL